MQFLLSNLVALAGLAWVVQGAFWTDILKGLQNAGRYKNFFDALGDAADDLRSDDDEAAAFICDILRGDIPDAVEALPSAVASEVEGDFRAITSFVGALPSIAPAVLGDIARGGSAAVSIVQEIVTAAPGEALTVVGGDAVSVWSDATAGAVSVVDDVTYFLGCGLPWESCASSASFTDNGIFERCSSVLHDHDGGSPSSSTASATPTSSSSLSPSSSSSSSSVGAGPTITSAATPGSSIEAPLPSQTGVDTATDVLVVTSSSTLVVNATSSPSSPISTDSPPVNEGGREGNENRKSMLSSNVS
ncbi:hypothetical protein Hte_008103 [Hypoxylon texense]